MRIKSLLLVILLASFFSCSSGYIIKSEIPKGITLNNYKVINLGWLDLNENMWKELGYSDQDKWVNFLNEINKKDLPTYLKKYYKDKQINSALSKNEINKQPGLNIIFTNTKFIPRDQKNMNSIAQIFFTIHFIDSSTGKEIFKSDAEVNAFGQGALYALEMQIYYGLGNISAVINKIIGN